MCVSYIRVPSVWHFNIVLFSWSLSAETHFGPDGTRLAKMQNQAKMPKECWLGGMWEYKERQMDLMKEKKTIATPNKIS